MNDQLIKWADEGYAPSLLYDDDGHWAISFAGVMCVSNPADQSFYDDDLVWRDTPQEAVDAVLNEVGHGL